jgi:Protein of unknown function (DUF3309)
MPLAGRRVQKVLILLIILIVLLFGSVPAWPHSRGWGYYPSGGLGLVVLILVILLLMGRI